MIRQKYTTTLSAIRSRADQFDAIKVQVGTREGSQTIGADFMVSVVERPSQIPNTDAPIFVEEFRYENRTSVYIGFKGERAPWN